MNAKYREIVIRNSLRNFPLNILKTTRCFMSMMKSGEWAAYPYKIQMELTNVCNLSCTMCPIDDLERGRGYLKFEDFKKIYDQILPPYVTFTGIGEGLLNPDIFKIISYAKSRGSFAKMDTNGMLLTEKRIRRLLATKVDIISNSIDGMDKETYEAIRRKSNFDTVISNLKNLVRIRNETGSNTEIHIFLVLQKSNYKQFPEFIKFGDSIGVNSISGTFISNMSHDVNKDYTIEHCDEAELDNLMRQVIELKKTVRANLEESEIIRYIKNWKEKKVINWAKVACFRPWYAPFINWDGDVCMCCYCVDKEVVFGNALKEPFAKLWNNEKARAMRKMVRTNRVGVCAQCQADETFIKESFQKIPLYNKISTRQEA
jgi:radical SAM protein with 4Fe4S-binding SPASM domain